MVIYGLEHGVASAIRCWASNGCQMGEREIPVFVNLIQCRLHRLQICVKAGIQIQVGMDGQAFGKGPGHFRSGFVPVIGDDANHQAIMIAIAGEKNLVK